MNVRWALATVAFLMAFTWGPLGAIAFVVGVFTVLALEGWARA